MPEISGIELTKKIRRNGKLKHLPVVMLTAYSSPEHLVDCVKAGASGFLVKPPRKNLLQQELGKARRIYNSRQSPRLCDPSDAERLEDALSKLM